MDRKNWHSRRRLCRYRCALVTNRRYEDGILYYRKAIAATPDLWRAHSQLGVNLMRFGQNDEARKELEIAYNNDYRDAATANSLKLIDSYKDFETFSWPNATVPVGILRLNKKRLTPSFPYFEPEMKRAMATYEKKYGYKMDQAGSGGSLYQSRRFRSPRDGPARYWGILGVTFDNIVAMDGPSARDKTEGYHWASVMWHELSHVYVLNMTERARAALVHRRRLCPRRNRHHARLGRSAQSQHRRRAAAERNCCLSRKWIAALCIPRIPSR